MIITVMVFFNLSSASQTINPSVTRETSSLLNNDEIPIFLNIDNPEDGYYYLSFWIHPTLYKDGSFSKYKVFVNEDFIGMIAIEKEGWQSASLENGRTVYLKKGTNTVMITSLSPEVPCVEAVKASVDSFKLGFSSEAYSSYVNKLRHNSTFSKNSSFYDPRDFFSFTDTTFLSVPLNYSFYLIREYNQNDEISFSTTSSTPHKLDIFYYGERTIFNPIPLGNGNLQKGIGDPIVIRIKNAIAYEPATDSESQGLNWLGISEPSVSNNHTIYKTITIPKKGLYMIKLRGSENGVQGLANLSINQTEYHNNCPFSYYGRPIEFSASNNEYTAMAYSAWPGKSDPMLFVEGNVSERIVAFNDDHNASGTSSYGLDEWDPFVRMAFFVKTSAIHLCNYGSLNPDTTCTLRVIDNYGNSANVFSPLMPDDNSLIMNCEKDKSESVILMNMDGIVSISTNHYVRFISVYDISGLKICEITPNDSQMYFHISELNISHAGVYIMRIITDKGFYVKKISIN